MKNLMKFLLALYLGVTLIFFVSCSDDEDTTVTDTTGDTTGDTTAPTITISSPSSGAFAAAGGSLVPDISVSDETGLASATLSIGNGTVTVLSADIDISTGTYSSAITLPDDVVLGNHTITVTATDAAGNSTTDTVGIIALPKLDEGKVTIILQEVPAQPTDYSTDPIYLIGSMEETSWDLGNAIALTAYTDSEGHTSYYAQVGNTADAMFKFIRGPLWTQDNRNADGSDYGNKPLTSGDIYIFAPVIGTWQDYNPQVVISGGSNMIIDGIPTDSMAQITANVFPGATSGQAISTVTYTFSDSTGTEIASGAMATENDTLYSADLDVSSLSVGNYTVNIVAVDAVDAQISANAIYAVAVFPCDDSGLDAVDASLTRIVLNVPPTDNYVYATGSYFTGNDNGWGGVDAAGTNKLTKISDGCYYLDVVVTLKTVGTGTFQFYQKDPADTDESSCEWWKNRASLTEGGGDPGHDFTVSEANSGKTYKVVFPYWVNKCVE